MHRGQQAEGARDRAVPLLAGGVPNLGLDDLAVDLEAAGGELDADGGLGLEAELVLGEAGEEVGLAHAGVADEHHLEEVVVVVLRPVPASRGRHCPPLRAAAALVVEARGVSVPGSRRRVWRSVAMEWGRGRDTSLCV
uniref:DUF834 domain-containing protein n=1 Tax=Oryza brachyantha TaxID=4533 RepID=J3M8W5_ORYBR